MDIKERLLSLWNSRLKSVLLVTLALGAVLVVMVPHMLGILMNVGVRLGLGACAGYGVYRFGFPREPGDDAAQLTWIKASCICAGLIAASLVP